MQQPLSPSKPPAAPRSTQRSATEQLLTLVADQASGQLVIATDTADIRLYLEQGQLAWGRSNQSPSGFNRTLKAQGVARETIQALVDDCRQSKRPIDEVLVASGILDDDQVRVALRAQVLSTLGDLCHLTGPAKVLFVPRRDPPPRSARITFALDDLRAEMDEAGADCDGPVATISSLPTPLAAEAEPQIDLSPLEEVAGFVGAALVETATGESVIMQLAQDFPLEVVASGNALMVAAKRETMRSLGMDDVLDDVVVSLGRHFHVLRPLDAAATHFVSLVVERPAGNLALARFALQDFVNQLGR